LKGAPGLKYRLAIVSWPHAGLRTPRALVTGLHPEYCSPAVSVLPPSGRPAPITIPMSPLPPLCSSHPGLEKTNATFTGLWVLMMHRGGFTLISRI
jgi:hypothetical protein